MSRTVRDVPGPQTLTLGLDEAGRGSVLGPLVVGACAMTGPLETAQARLTALGARDSKLLTAGRREEVLARLRKEGSLTTVAASPTVIDRAVGRGELNLLEVRLMARLIARVRPTQVLVDACDPDAERFGRTLERHAAREGWEVRVLARHKADRDFPLVGAASIVAKVTRDRALVRLAARVEVPIGSGYPSDPETRAYVAGLLRAGGPLPEWVRRSWSTVDTLKSPPRVRPLEGFS